MSDARTIAELESQRYDWIAAECCKGTVWVPFRMIRANHPRWNLAAMTLDQVGQKLRCEHCGNRGHGAITLHGRKTRRGSRGASDRRRRYSRNIS